MMENLCYPAPNTLLSLSDEVFLIIFSFLSTEEKIVLSQVCRRFNRVLFDQKLTRNFEISPNHNEFCLKYAGSYMQHRRKLITSFNINNCDGIPMQQMKLMTKGLTNLVSLHVMNISMPVSVLSGILKHSMQMQELSWTWRGDEKRVDVTWANVPAESKQALSKLRRLFISLPDPWCHAVLEFLNYCSGLAHLTMQLDPALRKLRIYKQVENYMVFPFKLKSFCAYYVSYGDCIDRQTIFLNDILFEHFIEKIWTDSGELSNQWENFWPHSTSRMSWLRDIQVSPDFPNFISNVKNAILSTTVFPAFNHELKATDLIIYVESSSLPVIHKLAPKVERLTIEVSPSSEMVDNIISSLPGLKYIVELNLVSVHLCRNNAFLNNFWVVIRSLESLKKLAVDTCAITGLKIFGQFVQEDGSIRMLEEWSVRVELDNLEVFQLDGRLDPDVRCESYSVMPNVGAISAWKNLTSLTFNSIPAVRKFDHFRLVAQACVQLEELRFRAIGPHGHCMYIKDVANSLPYCQKLRNFSIEQGHIADFLKDLLQGLSHCPVLESVCIYNSDLLERSHLKCKNNMQETILNLIKKCHLLNFIRVPVPHVAKSGCNKMKNWITPKLDRPRSKLFMEFCEKLAINEDQFHAFPPDVPRLWYMRWTSRVCETHECVL